MPPVEVRYLPSGQHVLLVPPVQYLPAGQVAQDEFPVVVLYVPATQVVQLVAPSEDDVPAAQSVSEAEQPEQ